MNPKCWSRFTRLGWAIFCKNEEKIVVMYQIYLYSYNWFQSISQNLFIPNKITNGFPFWEWERMEWTSASFTCLNYKIQKFTYAQFWSARLKSMSLTYIKSTLSCAVGRRFQYLSFTKKLMLMWHSFEWILWVAKRFRNVYTK